MSIDVTTYALLRNEIKKSKIDISNASVGQIIKVAAVDDAGKPIEWEPADLPEQAQSDWNQNDETAPDFVQNRPFYDCRRIGEEVSIAFDSSKYPIASDEFGTNYKLYNLNAVIPNAESLKTLQIETINAVFDVYDDYGNATGEVDVKENYDGTSLTAIIGNDSSTSLKCIVLINNESFLELYSFRKLQYQVEHFICLNQSGTSKMRPG